MLASTCLESENSWGAFVFVTGIQLESRAVLPSPSFQIADRCISFSRILVWFCGFYFLNRKRERKTTRRTRENDAGTTRPSDFKKKSVIPVLEPPFFPTKLFYGHMRDRKMTWRQERASYAGRYSRYQCFIVHHFAETKDCRLRVQQNTSLTHSQRRRQVRSILVGLAFTWREMSIKPPWSMLKSAQRKANAKETQHASLFYDERPVGKLQDERKLAAFIAFFCLSVLHKLRLDRTWSLFMMQTSQKYCWSWSGFVFDIFNFADFTTAFPYCGKHFEFP